MITSLILSAAGWGAIDGVNQEYTNDLHYVTLQTLTNADCRSRLIAAGRPAELIFDDTICTFNSPEQGSEFGNEIWIWIIS